MEKPGTVLLFLVHVLIGCSLAIGNLKTDRDSLLALKSHITSDPLNFLKNNWTTETSVCNWIGVACHSRHQRVTELDISDKGLVGTLTPDLGNLSFLVSMNMSSNFFHGPIPVSIFNMSSLEYLSLWNNSLSGSLPDEVCGQNGARLQELDLSFNELHGKLPLNLDKCTQLRGIDLSGNKIDGHVPRQIGNMTKLVSVDLSMNNLDGTISEEISHLYSLSMLNMGDNKLTGPILPSVFNMSTLQTLDLSNNSLSGPIPPTIGNMSNLQSLSLSANHLSGQIPGEIGNLSNMTDLILHSNKLVGEIPSSICNLRSLETLHLSSNSLEGEIPGCLGNSSKFLSYLILYSNKLVGEIPSSIFYLRSLEYLHLSRNSLKGEIPGCLGNLSKSLRALQLKRNNFRGLVPLTFTKGCALESLVLNGNHLEGELPKSLVNCERLQVVDIGNNGMQDVFPFWMETLKDLRVLVLRSNRFNGEISLDSRTNVLFPKLQVFDISHNEFTGFLPTTYFENFVAMVNAQQNTTGNENWLRNYEETMEFIFKGLEQSVVRILKTFITIDLSCNKFNGSIPDFIGKLNYLRYLNLSYNSLTGGIPISLGNVSVLESLDLSSNELVGIIPQELTKLTFLSILNLSSNNLVGQIPQSNQFSTFENSSYMENSGLCGSPLTKKCHEDKGAPTIEPLQESDDSSFIDGFTWQSVVLGYGFGTLVGIVTGHLIFFRYGKPRWLVNFFLGPQYNPKDRRRRDVVRERD